MLYLYLRGKKMDFNVIEYKNINIANRYYHFLSFHVLSIKDVHNYQRYFENSFNFSNYISCMRPDIMQQTKNRYENTVFVHANYHYTIEICKNSVQEMNFFHKQCV